MGRAWALAGAYAGSIIGAGFASGQELLRFFAAFGSDGLWGMGVSAALFALFGALIIDRVRVFSCVSHRDLLRRLCGLYLGSVIDLVLSILLFASLGVMLAAAGELVSQQFGLPFTFGVLATAAITREIVRREPSRLLRLNGALVIALVVLTLAVLLPVIRKAPFPASITASTGLHGMVPRNWFAGAVLYSSFNIAMALSPLGALGHRVQTRCEGVTGALVGGTLLGLVGGVILIAILQELPYIAAQELPILALLRLRLPVGAPVYGMVLYLALLTSCIAVAFGLGYRAGSTSTISARKVAGWLPILVIPVAYLGFGNLVQTLYPIVGYMGLGVALVAGLRRLLIES